jgi:glycosyl transferase family 2
VSEPSLVSVVIPSFNGGGYLGEAIDSALAQTYPAVEIVVVDDGSTDDTRARVARYGDRVRYLHQENRGLPGARNTGIRAARGSYLAFLDHDDRFLPEKLARQVAVLEARPDVGLVYTGWHFIDGDGRRLPPTGWDRRDGDVLADLIVENMIYPAAAMVRKAPVDAVGGFDETLTGLEDWDLWLRLALRGVHWACVDEPLLEYRVHPGQMHKHGADRRLRNRLAILDKVRAAPDLAPEIRALEAVARQNAYLQAAAHRLRAGERREGADAFAAAVACRPALVADARALMRFARLLFPTGSQKKAAVVAARRSVMRTLRTAVDDLFARPDLDPAVRRLRWPARVALIRLGLRLARKGVGRAVASSGLATR